MSRYDLLPDPRDTDAEDRWIAVAQAVADTLREDAAARDRANVPPRTEVELLRERGLLTLAAPRRAGGEEVRWRTLAQIVRLIARADSSIAHILGYHYVWVRFIASFDTAAAERALRETVTHRWLWASPGNNRETGYPPLRPVDDGFVVAGSSGFASGGPLADRLFSIVMSGDDARLTIVEVDPAQRGVRFDGDWDVLGQRLSASTSVHFDDVRIAEDRVLKTYGPVAEGQQPRQSVQVLHFQLVFSLLHLGLTEGALEEAARYTRQHTRAWIHSAHERGRDEPYILSGYGTHVARTTAAAALVEQAVDALEWLYDLGDVVTATQRAAVAEIIAAAKIVTAEVGLEATSAVFELTGARATAHAVGLDRFWRGLRTITLHDAIAYKREEVGRFYLNGESPQPSGVR